jgi:lipopolysaccharide transport system ATP-binding protein
VIYRTGLSLFGGQSRRVLTDISFELFAGETLGILGRNGAGKSTLMALLADIIAPDEGSVKRHTHRIQLLSLQAGFMNQLTGRQNAIMAGMLLGLRRKDMLARMDRIISFSELGESIDEPLRNYSAGMRARLGFAISIQSDPDVLLIDEVLGVGDAAFRPKAKAVITERIRSEETVVIVSHQEETLKEYCDRVAWIDKGQLRMLGETNKVLEAYRDTLASDSA